MERLKQLLGSAQFKSAVNQDFQLKLNFEQTNNLFSDYSTLLSTVDETVLFNNERQASTKYVFFSKVETLFDDSLATYFPSLTYDDINLLNNGRNFKIYISYPFKATPLNTFKSNVTAVISNNMLEISDVNNNYDFGDIITLYDDSGNTSFNRISVVSANTSTTKLITLQSNIPTAVTNNYSYTIPSVTQFKRDFKIISNELMYNAYESAFSVDIYNHPIQQFHFLEDIDIDGLKDCFNNPITEMYTTFLKITGFGGRTYSNNSYNVTAHELSSIINNITATISEQIFNTSGGTLGSTNISTSNLIFGDIYEYNTNTLSGKTVDVAAHKFTYESVDFLTTFEPFYYLPHQKLDIRKFSNSLEFGNSGTTSNIPYYSLYYNNSGDTQWRDLLEIGFLEETTNGVNYPYLNGRHYIFSDIKLNLLRVNPLSASTNTTATAIDVLTSNNINLANLNKC